MPCPLLQDMGPEFIKILDEPLVVLELPGSIVVSQILPLRECGDIYSSLKGHIWSRGPNLRRRLRLLSLPQSKKGKSPTTHRELSVVMPNGQSILVKCEVKSRGGDVFDMIVAHSNLMEHFYFGLAYIDGKEV